MMHSCLFCLECWIAFRLQYSILYFSALYFSKDLQKLLWGILTYLSDQISISMNIEHKWISEWIFYSFYVPKLIFICFSARRGHRWCLLGPVLGRYSYFCPRCLCSSSSCRNQSCEGRISFKFGYFVLQGKIEHIFF